MTDDDNKDAKSVKEKIPYYSYKNNFNYRAWKFSPAINVEWTSHYPIFPDGKRYKILPRKFVLRHYPFRNNKQIEKKIMNKTRGVNYSESKEGLADYSRKILKHKNDVTKIVNHKLLTKNSFF